MYSTGSSPFSCFCLFKSCNIREATSPTVHDLFILNSIPVPLSVLNVISKSLKGGLITSILIDSAAPSSLTPIQLYGIELFSIYTHQIMKCEKSSYVNDVKLSCHKRF